MLNQATRIYDFNLVGPCQSVQIRRPGEVRVPANSNGYFLRLCLTPSDWPITLPVPLIRGFLRFSGARHLRKTLQVFILRQYRTIFSWRTLEEPRTGLAGSGSENENWRDKSTEHEKGRGVRGEPSMQLCDWLELRRSLVFGFPIFSLSLSSTTEYFHFTVFALIKRVKPHRLAPGQSEKRWP